MNIGKKAIKVCQTIKGSIPRMRHYYAINNMKSWKRKHLCHLITDNYEAGDILFVISFQDSQF